MRILFAPTLRRALLSGTAAAMLAGAAHAEGKLSADDLAKVAVALGDHDEPMKVRLQAALILGRDGDARAVPALTGALGDPEFPVRAAAALSLGNVGDASVTDSLVGRLSDPESFVRQEAAEGLVNLEKRGEGKELRSGWKRRDPATRAALLDLVTPLGPQAGGGLLALGLSDPDPAVQESAKSILGAWRPPDVQRFIIAGLSDPDPARRVASADMAGTRRMSLAIPALQAMLVSSSETGETVAAARRALLAMAGDVDTRALAEQAARGDKGARLQAMATLAAVHAPDAFPVLMGALDDPDLDLRGAAALDLGVLGDARAADKIAVLAGRDENASILITLQTALRTVKTPAK